MTVDIFHYQCPHKSVDIINSILKVTLLLLIFDFGNYKQYQSTCIVIKISDRICSYKNHTFLTITNNK